MVVSMICLDDLIPTPTILILSPSKEELQLSGISGGSSFDGLRMRIVGNRTLPVRGVIPGERSEGRGSITVAWWIPFPALQAAGDDTICQAAPTPVPIWQVTPVPPIEQ